MIYGKPVLFRTLSGHSLKRHMRYACCACIVMAMSAMIIVTAHAQDPLFSKIRKTIILDPGHGGRDFGSKGADNTYEKDIALTFAKSMEDQLKDTYNVILTRSDDYDLDVTTRTATANRSGGDLFISIHTGGNFIHESQGIVLYHYQKDPVTVTDTVDSGPGSQRRWNDAQNKYSAVSRALALSLQDRLSKTPQLANVTVEGLCAKVLAGADMPAILIEPGYVTSPHDEKRLNDSGYVHDFSKKVCESIHEYFNAYSQSD